MKVNVTSGDILNGILSDTYCSECFVPFNEAMIVGSCNAPLFSSEFMAERADTHGVSLDEYVWKLRGFLDVLDHIEKYDEIILWFGDEPFCKANTKTVLQALKDRSYNGKLILNIVNEQTAKIVKSEVLQHARR